MIDAEIQSFADLLESASAFLLKHGEPGWSSWLAKDARLVRNGDFYGVEHLNKALEGAGSLNDLILHPINGNPIAETDVKRVNQELREMLLDLGSRARALSRETGR